MDYTLALLTHGDARTLRRAVESLIERVSPFPSAVIVFADGCTAATLDRVVSSVNEELPTGTMLRAASTHPDRQVGFCDATRRLWDLATDWSWYDARYTFWLEADFVFLRDVDLIPMARLLDDQFVVAQVALIRDVANADEARAGGLVKSRPGEFIPLTFEGHPWMQQTSYFTTNPSLMRTAFMRAEPFLADGQPHCEGRYGIDLRDRGYVFGAWGHGEEWVGHMGIRDNSGFGY